MSKCGNISSVKLKKVDLEHFRTVIYAEYNKIFPDNERKPYTILKDTYTKGMLDFIEIQDNEQFVGFVIIDHIPDNPYILLDYLAILPKFQNKGYGSRALELLSKMYKEYDGLFIEVEKICEAIDKEDEIQRQRRIKFYENVGCTALGIDLNLFDVIFSAYMLPCAKNSFEASSVVGRMFEMYTAILGKDRVAKNCSYVVNEKVVKK